MSSIHIFSSHGDKICKPFELNIDKDISDEKLDLPLPESEPSV